MRQTLDALAGSSAKMRVLVSRLDDDVFETQLVIDSKLLKAPPFDLEQMRGAIRWARDREAPIVFAFARWRRWATLGPELRIREVLHLCEGTPLRLAVHVSAPTTERGEEPAGGADLRLDMELPGDVRVEQMIEMAYTSDDVHAQIAADFEK
ncbi:MAG TPA: hypothetical protein VGH87_04250, partial [Polyangiaceae bacterium]